MFSLEVKESPYEVEALESCAGEDVNERMSMLVATPLASKTSAVEGGLPKTELDKWSANQMGVISYQTLSNCAFIHLPDNPAVLEANDVALPSATAKIDCSLEFGI